MKNPTNPGRGGRGEMSTSTYQLTGTAPVRAHRGITPHQQPQAEPSPFAWLHAMAAKLPSGDPLFDACLLAEIACQCHTQLRATRAWRSAASLDAGDIRRLDRFLDRAYGDVSELANDLYHYAKEPAPAPEPPEAGGQP